MMRHSACCSLCASLLLISLTLFVCVYAGGQVNPPRRHHEVPWLMSSSRVWAAFIQYLNAWRLWIVLVCFAFELKLVVGCGVEVD